MNDVKSILLREEGLSLRPYKCTQGFLTIGVGRNLDTHGISKDEAFLLLDNDIKHATDEASEFPWFHLLSENRKTVVVCMIFQLGIEGFKRFQKTIAALTVGDYDLASAEMIDSQWYRQTPARAELMSEMMRNG